MAGQAIIYQAAGGAIGAFSQSRLGRLLNTDVEDRPLYSFVCPDDVGPFHARLVEVGHDGRDLYAVAPCFQGSSSSSSSGTTAGVATTATPHGPFRGGGGSDSSSSSDGNGGYRMARLIQEDVDGRPLYAAENPCCPDLSDSSSSASSSPGASQSSSSQPSASRSAASGASGASGASSSAGRRISVPCCPGITLPEELYLSLSGGFGTMVLTWDESRNYWAGCVQVDTSGGLPRWFSFAFSLSGGSCTFLCRCFANADQDAGCSPVIVTACAGILTSPIQCSPFEVNLRMDGGGFTGCPTTPPFPLTGVLTE